MIKRVIRDDIELSLNLGDDADSVRVDRGQMTQVLLNLAVNSRDAMPNGGKLTIETRTEEGLEGVRSIVLEVRDTGFGMDQETQSHIFEPFFTTKEEGKGTGLGLANVYGIVKQSEGTIACASAVGKGTRFLISLPAAEATQTAPGEPTRTRTKAKGTEKILLVEDDENVRTITKMILEEAGYSVQIVPNGEEALRIWSAIGEDIDIVVSDVVMPVMRGTEMAQQIRQITPKTRFLFMSGYNDHGDPQLGSVDAFLQKPANPEVLLSAVRKVLDG
jgi:two-component system, cell cycle sensor histidine kinase and response regulator CckA